MIYIYIYLMISLTCRNFKKDSNELYIQKRNRLTDTENLGLLNGKGGNGQIRSLGITDTHTLYISFYLYIYNK